MGLEIIVATDDNRQGPKLIDLSTDSFRNERRTNFRYFDAAR